MVIWAILAKIHLANGVNPQMMENCGEHINITIGLNVNNVILKMGIIIL